MLNRFFNDERGAELAEYAVAAAMLVAIGLIVYTALGQGISDTNSQTGSAIPAVTTNVTP